jgi:aminobenzoyl-glutamate utilization protein B
MSAPAGGTTMKTGISSFAALAFVAPLAIASPRETALDWLSRNESRLVDTADDLWEHPEPAHRELRTSALLKAELSREGFTVQSGIAGLPTAFVASSGSSRPIIGIVALLDALPGLAQEKLASERQPIEGLNAGHGCGHNLIAAADLGAVVAVARALSAHHLPGTIRFYGAPAEEIYHGGVYMVRAGAFDDLDALLFWHPSSVTTVIGRSGLAMDSVRFSFLGQPSDATDAADKGRNALSAAIRLSASVTAHGSWSSTAVVNQVLVDGGEIPSIVPERALAWYFIHGRDRAEVTAVRNDIESLANEAARASGTEVEMQILSSTRHWLINHTLAERLQHYLEEEPPGDVASEESGLAARLRVPFDARADAPPFFRGTLPMSFGDDPVPISDDTAEASWVVPRGGFLVGAFPAGVPSHTWQWTSFATTRFAHRAMMRAARTLVATAIDLVEDADLLERARAEFRRATKGARYESPLPSGRGPFDFLRAPETKK